MMHSWLSLSGVSECCKYAQEIECIKTMVSSRFSRARSLFQGSGEKDLRYQTSIKLKCHPRRRRWWKTKDGSRHVRLGRRTSEATFDLFTRFGTGSSHRQISNFSTHVSGCSRTSSVRQCVYYLPIYECIVYENSKRN